MADVFLSYARLERDKAEPIRDALIELGLDVFFDVDGLDGGDVFPDVLDREVKQAGAVVSLWSPLALTRPWIKIESRIGKDRGVLIPIEIAALDSLHDVPAAFYDDQRIDLVDFDGNTSSPGWLKLIKSLARTLERPDLIEKEVQSHAHSAAEAGDLRSELASLNAQMEDLTAAKQVASATDRAREKAFAIIENSISLSDYRRFLERFNGGAEAFDAERRLDQLDLWAEVDKDDPEAIDRFLNGTSLIIYPALATEARRVQRQARRASGRSKKGLWIGSGFAAALVAAVAITSFNQSNTDGASAPYVEQMSEAADEVPVLAPSESSQIEIAPLQSELNSLATETTPDSVNSDQPVEADADGSRQEQAARIEAIRGLQRELAGLGYYSSRIDGLAGSGTRSAIAQFAAETGETVLELETASQREIERLTALVNTERLNRTEQEAKAWQTAQNTNTASAYRAYLADYPSGTNADLARRQIAVLATPDKPIFDADAAGLRGREARKRGEFALALREYQSSCDAGSPIGCSGLGTLYQMGQGVPRDYNRARSLYEQACLEGYLMACSNIGTLYQLGQGVPRDYGRARTLYEQACDGGEVMGCANLGTLYQSGIGVGQDYGRARKLYEQACEGDEMAGCASLGALYQIGQGAPLDYDRARNLYERACSGGHMMACSNLGSLYDYALGVSQDYYQARILYQKACDGAEMRGCTLLGELYEVGHGVLKDLDRAGLLYQEACNNDYAKGCANLGGWYASGHGGPENIGKALSFSQTACEREEMKGCFNLGLLYEKGIGVTKDFQRATAFYKKACDGGNYASCINLGAMYYRGELLAKDYTRARPLFEKACTAGATLGCAYLGIFYEKGLGGLQQSFKLAKEAYQKACSSGIESSCRNLNKLPD